MIESVIAIVAIVIGGLCGYFIFRYVINGKYKALMDTAEKDAEVLKEKKRWYVLYGFNKNEESKTGYLSFRQKPSFKYEVVDDIKLAKRFPADNYDKLDDFAPPEKWMKFFNQEHELSDWKFHLVATTGLQSEIKKNEQP